LPLLVAEGVLSHTITFECVGQCSWKVLNCRRDVAVVQCTAGTVHGRLLCTRVVAVSEPDVLVTYLTIERAGNYDLIGRPVVHDGLVRLQAPCHCHTECVSRFSCMDGVFLYFDVALSSHCGFFRASVFLERSLLENSETRTLDC